MQHVSHRASDERAHPRLSRDILNRLGQRLRIEFEDTYGRREHPTPRMAVALDKLKLLECPTCHDIHCRD